MYMCKSMCDTGISVGITQLHPFFLCQDKCDTVVHKPFLSVVATEKILATVPNINVLLNEELFMEVIEPDTVRYTFKLRLAKNFGMPFVSKPWLIIFWSF